MSYYKAVMYGCEKAFGMPQEIKWTRKDTAEQRKVKAAKRREWYAENAWHPHQVRHRMATDLRKVGGKETAKIVLGHTDDDTTEIYALPDVEKARAVMERVG
jgi:integrase